MNDIVGAVCRHVAKGERIVAVEPEPKSCAIVIYLADGSIHHYPRLALCMNQFRERWKQAKRLFPRIRWHDIDGGDAIPEWLDVGQLAN